MKNISQHAKNIHHFNFREPHEKPKTSPLALTLGTTTIATTQAAEPDYPSPKTSRWLLPPPNG